MIRHIVAFRLKSNAPETRAEHARLMSEILEPLSALDEVHSLTVRPDLRLNEANWHVVLVSEHQTVQALEGYQAHPEHKAAAALARIHVAERLAIDYEL